MSNADIKQKINEILIEEFEVDAEVIQPEAPLRESLDLDSLDYVDLVVLIESNFGVKLGEADFAGMTTFQDFYSVIEHKISTK
ncbi:acyl carrier protein [Sphingobacterium nematocida]|uniref:Acyl carrier protein n=1 Tax=Sphingobacterium nematocida TaxID=1513896 RepID=A0A1T5EQX9_9SPHI|nr:phosphopantetheine-binding protein [Sphingobacterium nematocida]SKB86315.1 acyl carrier protein [Sphingobacterium nematocida]